MGRYLKRPPQVPFDATTDVLIVNHSVDGANRFHALGKKCLPPYNRLRVRRDDAVELGWQPCGRCKP